MLVHGALAALGLVACGEGTEEPRRYTVVEGWPQLGDVELGQVSGVGVDARDDVVVFRRAGRTWDGGAVLDDPIEEPTLLRLGADDGAVTASLAADRFVMPHGLTIDRDDNLWLTDVGLHQVFKLSPDGELLMALGERGVPGADEGHFDRPTDVAVAADGSFYVSDGYGNSRVVKFDADGTFLFEWGGRGDAEGSFDVPHGIALDADGRVYVADRGNARVQVFDPDGTFLSVWQGEAYGRPWSLAFGPAGEAFLVDGGDQVETPPDRSRILRTTADGRVLEVFGAYGHEPGQMVWPHDIAIDAVGNAYVAEVSTGMRVKKFSPRPR